MKKQTPKVNNTPKPVVQARINIDIMSDGNIRVSKFPTNYAAAMQIMNQAMLKVSDHFIRAAINGNLDKQGTLGGSNIVIPNIVLPKGAINRG